MAAILTGFLTAIFLGEGGLGVTQFAQEKIAQAQGTPYQVRVGIGQSANKSDNLGGNQPGVSLWNARGEAIGGVLGTKKIHPDGSFIDFPIHGNKSLENNPAEYIAISAGGDDAICVAYVSVTNPDATARLWLGDVGQHCGADWFHSLLSFGDNVTPKCVWIDRNGSNGLRFQGIGIHMPSFSTVSQQKNNNDGELTGLSLEYNTTQAAMCNSKPRFHMYPILGTEDRINVFDPPLGPDNQHEDGTDRDLNTIIGAEGKVANWNMDLLNKACAQPGTKSKTCNELGMAEDFPIKRGLPIANDTASDRHEDSYANNTLSTSLQPVASSRPGWISTHLVVSHLEQHSAIEVCKSATSRGPSFISMKEMKYCDMGGKILWDVCSDSTTMCCFDVAKKQMRSCGFRLLNVVDAKQYETIDVWEAVKQI